MYVEQRPLFSFLLGYPSHIYIYMRVIIVKKYEHNSLSRHTELSGRMWAGAVIIINHPIITSTWIWHDTFILGKSHFKAIITTLCFFFLRKVRSFWESFMLIPPGFRALGVIYLFKYKLSFRYLGLANVC